MRWLQRRVVAQVVERAAQRPGQRVRTWRSSASQREPAREEREDVDPEASLRRSTSPSHSTTRAGAPAHVDAGRRARRRTGCACRPRRRARRMSCATPSSTAATRPRRRSPCEHLAADQVEAEPAVLLGLAARPRPAARVRRRVSASAPSRSSMPSSATSGRPLGVPATASDAPRVAVHEQRGAGREVAPPARRRRRGRRRATPCACPTVPTRTRVGAPRIGHALLLDLDHRLARRCAREPARTTCAARARCGPPLPITLPRSSSAHRHARARRASSRSSSRTATWSGASTRPRTR